MLMSIIKFPGGRVGRADVKLYHKTSRAFALLLHRLSEFNRAMRWWPLRGQRRVARNPIFNVLTSPSSVAREKSSRVPQVSADPVCGPLFLTRKKDREDSRGCCTRAGRTTRRTRSS